MAIDIQFTSRNGSGSEALMQVTTEKFERLYKFSPKITKIHVIFSSDHLIHTAEAELHIPKMKPVYAEAKTDDMYKSIDLLVDKLVKQLAKHKEKISDH